MHYFDVPLDELWRRLEVRNAIGGHGVVPISRELLDESWIKLSRPIRPNCRCSIDTSCIPRNKRTANAGRDQASAAVCSPARSAQRHPFSTTAGLFRVAESHHHPIRTGGREFDPSRSPIQERRP